MHSGNWTLVCIQAATGWVTPSLASYFLKKKIPEQCCLRLWWTKFPLPSSSTLGIHLFIDVVVVLFLLFSLFCFSVRHPCWLPRIPPSSKLLLSGAPVCEVPRLDIAHCVLGIALVSLNDLPFPLKTIFGVCTPSLRIEIGQPKESDLKGLPRHVSDLPRSQGGPHSLSSLLLLDCRCLEIVAMEATQNFVEKSLGKKTESWEWQGGKEF